MKCITYRVLFDNNDNVVDRRHLGLRRTREQGNGEDLNDLYSSPKLFGWSNQKS